MSSWVPAGSLSLAHITHFPDSQRHSLGWIWGRCHPASPLLLAYLLHGFAWLCCRCWQARKWKNKRWRCGSVVRAWPCKHGVSLPAQHWRDIPPWQPLPQHWSLAWLKLLTKLWRHKKHSSKDKFQPWTLIKGWLEPPKSCTELHWGTNRWAMAALEGTDAPQAWSISFPPARATWWEASSSISAELCLDVRFTLPDHL